jgi:TonB-linked SusC/RagA family outer membrane protein
MFTLSNNIGKNKFMDKRYLIAAALCLASSSAIQAASAATNTSLSVQQQKGNVVQGTIVDQNGEPVIGATVRVKGSKTGTVTDLDGKFTLTNANGPIEVSYIGYKTQIVKNAKGNNLRISLQEDANALEDVVVVGYGQQKKASLTSAITQIKGEEVFKDRTVSSTAVALQGEIPGLTVTRTSTRPGSEGASFQIRGDISVNGNSSPLIIIDGVTGSLNELNSMNGNDIDNISVLKDASAAIYGSRAASGVILVTTKRGKEGKAHISYNGSISRTINGIQVPMTSTSEWLDMFYEAQYNDARVTSGASDPTTIHNNINWWIFNTFGGPSLDESDIDPETGNPTVYKGEKLFNALRSGKVLTVQNGNKIERWDPTFNIMDALYGQATSQKHNVNISGADQRFGYNLSLGYESAKSQLKPAYDGQRKWSGRLNADYKATEDLKFATNISYEKRDVQSPSTDVGQGWMDQWFWSIYNENGDPYDTFSGNRNPIGGLTQGGTYKYQLTTLRGNVSGTYDFKKFVKGLSLTGNAAYKMVEQNSQTTKYKVQYYDWVGTETGNKQAPGSMTQENKRWENINLSALLNYQNTFAKYHNVAAMVGMTAEQETNKNLKLGRYKGPMYENAGIEDMNLFIGGDNNAANGGKSSWGLLSYLTRVSYNFDNRYSVEFLGRRDGSSKLSTAQRWKNFYSISGYWRISGEKWMKSLTWLNDLKLRYNYGKTGSVEGIGNYERYATVSTGSTILGVNPSAHTTMWLGGMTSDQRTWETIDSHNFGLDFTLLNNRLSGSFDYFIKTNNGMFISVEYPQILGATAPKVNNGKFRARGWEFALNWRDKIGEVKYNVGINLSDVWSEVLKLTNNENVPNAGKNSNRLIGKPRNAIYVYQTDGLFQTQEEVDAFYEMYYWNADHSGPKEGNILPAPGKQTTNTLRPGARKLVDLNGDGKITRDDIYYAGDAAPRLSFGFKAGLEWKGIDFNAFFQGIGKQKVLRSGNFYAPWVVNYVRQNKTFMGKMWSPENPNAEYAISSRDQNFNKWNYENKDVSVQNNKYIRLKSLVIGYTLPQAWTTKAGLSKLRVYFSGDDLWEWTKVKDGYDPEYGEASNNTFPFSRQLTFGLDLTF